MADIIRTEELGRCFRTTGGEFWALKNISIQVPEGRLTILKGRSGSGKTTLMNILGALDRPTSGKVFFAEQDITRGRAAILKAYYTRNKSALCPEEVLTVELNEQSNYTPYVLGRLFAVLEDVQSMANPGLNATIKDRYFNSACATPAVVFPTLLKLAQKHLQKLSTGSSIYFNQQITGLMSRMNAPFPARMTLPEQGAFEIGYYHQTQKRYEKKQ